MTYEFGSKRKQINSNGTCLKDTIQTLINKYYNEQIWRTNYKLILVVLQTNIKESENPCEWNSNVQSGPTTEP
jgi:hypothetical protein